MGRRPRSGPGKRWTKRKEASMLWAIVVILLLLWGLGLVSSYTLGGFIHFLLLLAIIVLLVRIIQGRRIIS